MKQIGILIDAALLEEAYELGRTGAPEVLVASALRLLIATERKRWRRFARQMGGSRVDPHWEIRALENTGQAGDRAAVEPSQSREPGPNSPSEPVV